MFRKKENVKIHKHVLFMTALHFHLLFKPVRTLLQPCGSLYIYMHECTGKCQKYQKSILDFTCVISAIGTVIFLRLVLINKT